MDPIHGKPSTRTRDACGFHAWIRGTQRPCCGCRGQQRLRRRNTGRWGEKLGYSRSRCWLIWVDLGPDLLDWGVGELLKGGRGVVVKRRGGGLLLKGGGGLLKGGGGGFVVEEGGGGKIFLSSCVFWCWFSFYFWKEPGLERRQP